VPDEGRVPLEGSGQIALRGLAVVEVDQQSDTVAAEDADQLGGLPLALDECAGPIAGVDRFDQEADVGPPHSDEVQARFSRYVSVARLRERAGGCTPAMTLIVGQAMATVYWSARANPARNSSLAAGMQATPNSVSPPQGPVGVLTRTCWTPASRKSRPAGLRANGTAEGARSRGIAPPRLRMV